MPFFLDISYDKYVAFEIIVLVGKNFLNRVENWGRNHMCQLVKKVLNSIKKQREKLGVWLIKNFLNLMRKWGGKLIIYYFCKGWKTSKI